MNCCLSLCLIALTLFVLAESVRPTGDQNPQSQGAAPPQDDLPSARGRGRGRGRRPKSSKSKSKSEEDSKSKEKSRNNRNKEDMKECYEQSCDANPNHLCACFCVRRPNSRFCRRGCKCELEEKKPEAQVDGDIKGVSKQRLRELQPLINSLVDGNREQSAEDNKGNSFRRIQKEQDKDGNKQVRVQQMYNHVPVFGAEIVSQRLQAATVDVEDKATEAPTGDTIDAPELNYDVGVFLDNLDGVLGSWNTQFDPQAALERFKRSTGVQSAANEFSETIIHVDASQGIQAEGAVNTAQIAYYVNYFTDEGDHPSRPTAFLDTNYNVIEQWDGIQLRAVASGRGPGGNTKMGYHYYGSGQPNLLVNQYSGQCTLETDDVRTVHLGWAYRNGKTTAHSFQCYEQTDTRVNGAYSPLNDAHYYAQRVSEQYRKWYKRDPLSSKPIMVKVHYRQNYDNAFWDGASVTFGDGSYFHPLVSLDIMAHEIGHGVTQQSSNLVYHRQSGGLNEAFSDMAGKAAERFVRGKSGVNWGLGHDITKGSKPMRCMDNPTCDGRSIDHVRNYYDGMDVHYSSGIFNKVFYLLSQKLWYDVWDAFDIFYVANTKLWGPYTTFEQAAELTLRAVDELKAGHHLPWSYYWVKTQDVVDAFYQVGLRCQKYSSYWDCRRV